MIRRSSSRAYECWVRSWAANWRKPRHTCGGYTVLTEDPRTVIAHKLAPGVSAADAAKVKADVTLQARQVLRAQLRDVLDAAQLLGVPAREMASLLTDVVGRRARESQAFPTPHPSEQPPVTPAEQEVPPPGSNVVAFDRARRPGSGQQAGPPRSQG